MILRTEGETHGLKKSSIFISSTISWFDVLKRNVMWWDQCQKTLLHCITVGSSQHRWPDFSQYHNPTWRSEKIKMLLVVCYPLEIMTSQHVSYIRLLGGVGQKVYKSTKKFIASEIHRHKSRKLKKITLINPWSQVRK